VVCVVKPVCLTLQAEVDSASKDLHKLERTLQVQESDLKALKHQLDEKESTVSLPQSSHEVSCNLQKQ